jgi:hypothetical protein
MGVELFITRAGAAKPEYYSLTGATGWENVWLPAAEKLGLSLVSLLASGAFTRVEPEYLPEIVLQLTRLREWMVLNDHELYVEHLNDVLLALATVSPGKDHVSFG